MTSEHDPIGVVRDLGALQDLLRRERQLSGFSQWELDQRTGLQDGYVGKLELWHKPGVGRRLNYVSLPLMLEALGLGLLVVKVRDIVVKPPPEDPEQLALNLRGGKMNRQRLAHHPPHAPAAKDPAKPKRRTAGRKRRKSRKR